MVEGAHNLSQVLMSDWTKWPFVSAELPQRLMDEDVAEEPIQEATQPLFLGQSGFARHKLSSYVVMITSVWPTELYMCALLSVSTQAHYTVAPPQWGMVLKSCRTKARDEQGLQIECIYSRPTVAVKFEWRWGNVTTANITSVAL